MNLKKSPAGVWPSLSMWLSFIVLANSVSLAQDTAQPDPPRPAVMAFQAEPNRIFDSNFGKAFLSKESFRYDPISGQLWKAKTVKGLISLPDDVQAFTEMMPGRSTPFDYYFEFELDSDQHVEDLKQVLAKRMPKQEERDGVLYYYSQYDDGAYIGLTKERRAIVASQSFEYNPRRFPALTETTERLLNETKKASAGMSVDFKSAARLMRSAVDFGAGNLPPSAQDYLTIPEKLVWARGDFVLVPDPEVRVVIECVNREAAEEVKETLEDLMELGKQSIENSQQPEWEDQVKFLDSIKCQAEGRQVVLKALLPLDLLAKRQRLMQETILMNDVRQSILSMINYESSRNEFPFHARPGQSPELSWRVRVLPFLEEVELYKQFDHTQPWDSEINRPLLELMPRMFGEGTETGLQWVQSDVRRIADITDGMSNTIAFIHNAPPVPWTEDRPLTHNDAVRMFLALKPGETMIVGMYDGSVRRISSDMKVETFEAMLTPNGGEVVQPDR
ncbi:MAG: DUF1559 domain-containing protein [Pirellulaceae bacterium]|nr:DUF1559 domain-containing protein [Pirellulaceae bacterium]